MLTAKAPAPNCPCQELVRDDSREDGARSRSPYEPYKPVAFPQQGAPTPSEPRSLLLPESPTSKSAASPGPDSGRDQSVDGSSFKVSFHLFHRNGLELLQALEITVIPHPKFYRGWSNCATVYKVVKLVAFTWVNIFPRISKGPEKGG